MCEAANLKGRNPLTERRWRLVQNARNARERCLEERGMNCGPCGEPVCNVWDVRGLEARRNLSIYITRFHPQAARGGS